MRPGINPGNPAADAHRHRPGPVRQVLECLERDFARPWKISTMSARAGLSEAHFHDVFRQTMGTTPHQWLLQRRLRAARERLLSSLDPVKRIAVECGFADSPSFAHAFRQHFGGSPKVFRERHLRPEKR
ncbi:MAG: AraC family transcriptional regulator [Candidatus Methylacidiphilales bacterium]|nr:AraC family transcriptional regulator [Candidatus Methylacidiphilales bacterium]